LLTLTPGCCGSRSPVVKAAAFTTAPAPVPRSATMIKPIVHHFGCDGGSTLLFRTLSPFRAAVTGFAVSARMSAPREIAGVGARRPVAAVGRARREGRVPPCQCYVLRSPPSGSPFGAAPRARAVRSSIIVSEAPSGAVIPAAPRNDRLLTQAAGDF
jgi:hypothetical protein